MKKRFLTSGIMAVILSAGLAALATTGCVSVPQPAPVSMPNKNDKPLAAGDNWLPEADAPTAKLEVDSRGALGGTATGTFTLTKVGITDVPAAAKNQQWRPIDVPAGTELTLSGSYKVEMPTHSTQRGNMITQYYDVYSGEVAFVCPALTAGKTYVLTCDWPFLNKKKMQVINRRHMVTRNVFALPIAMLETVSIIGMPDALVEVFQPLRIKSDAPTEGPSLLLYERTDDGKKKNKISLKLVYQYLIPEERGIPAP